MWKNIPNIQLQKLVMKKKKSQDILKPTLGMKNSLSSASP